MHEIKQAQTINNLSKFRSKSTLGSHINSIKKSGFDQKVFNIFNCDSPSLFLRNFKLEENPRIY